MSDAKTAASLPREGFSSCAQVQNTPVSSYSAIPPVARYVQVPTSVRHIIKFRYDVAREARLMENLEHNQGALVPEPDTSGHT